MGGDFSAAGEDLGQGAVGKDLRLIRQFGKLGSRGYKRKGRERSCVCFFVFRLKRRVVMCDFN